MLLLMPVRAVWAEGQPSLLLLPIVVHSAEDPEYVREGLSDMLASRFERIGALELLRGPEEGDGTTDPTKALDLAEQAGADFVLYGSFTRFGQGASLDVQCAPVSPGEGAVVREPLREIFVHSGSIGEIIPDLDELAGKVSRFARGEAVAEGGSRVPPVGGAPPPTESLQELTDRVAALEDALVELLQQSEEAETSEELR